jgi:hypothetical protein
VIVSEGAFIWVVTAIVIAIGVVWAVHDLLFLRRVLREGGDPAVRRDKIFGAIIGILLAAVGLIGAVRYHWGP